MKQELYPFPLGRWAQGRQEQLQLTHGDPNLLAHPVGGGQQLGPPRLQLSPDPPVSVTPFPGVCLAP